MKRDNTSAEPGMQRAASSPGPWILGPWKDLVLFIGTPLLIIPLVAIAQLRFSAEAIGLVGVMGARGHHLPGMLRAYGDRELFQRYRVRFIVAPVFLLIVCAMFATRVPDTLLVVLLLWGLWHGLAQVYGFMRIYDGKLGARSTWRARLDMAMCIAWFVGGLLHSPDKVADVLSQFYVVGGPVISSAMVDAFRGTWDVLTALVTAGFLVYTVDRWRHGEPCSKLKLLVMATSFSFWWYAMVYLKEIILGVAVFEIFHDVQYLAIVWVYNRTRVDKGRPVGAFTQFLFRPRTMLIALYVGLVVAYGCLSELSRVLDGWGVRSTMYTLIMASTFLHYYFDGFIWKIREQSTSEGLGMQGEKGTRLRTPPWFVHGLKWGAFVLPAAWLLLYPIYRPIDLLEWQRAVAYSVPDCARAQETLGSSLILANDLKQAQVHCERAIRLKPNFAVAHNDLGTILARQQQYHDAAEHFAEAVRLKPDYKLASDNFRTAKAMIEHERSSARP